MKKPNFFIVGAPKCGTTALSEYLRDHRNIFVSQPKEPHFFSTDLNRLCLVNDVEHYEKLFRDATDEHVAVGEASTGYLFSDCALENIRAYAPESKLVAMLRNPVDMVHAWHAQRLFATDEDETDFEAAWRLQDRRTEGNDVPRKCRHVKLLMYREIGMLGAQMAHVYEVFPREQVLAILFDDFVADTKRVYEETLDFLGVPQDGRVEFPRINENRRHRLRWLGEFTQNPPAPVRAVTKLVKRVTGKGELGFLNPLRDLNRLREGREPLRPEFGDELREAFAEDVATLSKLLGRNLDHWTRPAAAENR